MVEIEVAYEGQLHTACRHVPSGRELTTDAPVDNQGRGESFSPTDLLATGLGTCMLTVMGIQADRHGWPVDGARARVRKHMTTEGSRRVARLDVALAMPNALAPEARKVLERTAETCPVRLSLHPDIDVVVEFAWG